MAGVFKRTAHVALQSMQRWQRPSGEMWIVKNRADPKDFHGYESYSSHSQYNLLPMAMLSIAYDYAAKTDDVPEQLTPAEVGGFAFQLDKPFNKIFANTGGMYVELDVAADPAHNATGLLRVHKKNFNPQLGAERESDQYEDRAVSCRWACAPSPRSAARVEGHERRHGSDSPSSPAARSPARPSTTCKPSRRA